MGSVMTSCCEHKSICTYGDLEIMGQKISENPLSALFLLKHIDSAYCMVCIHEAKSIAIQTPCMHAL